LRSAAEFYFEAQKRWRQSRGDFNHDETIATSDWLRPITSSATTRQPRSSSNNAIEHAKKVFGVKSAYCGLMLREYADFLWDKGNYIRICNQPHHLLHHLADAKE